MRKKIQIVCFIIFIFILIFIGFKLFKGDDNKEVIQNITDDEKVKINIIGNFITYVELNDVYKEQSARAYNGDKNVSNKIVISYFQNDNQVSRVDTKKVGNFVVKYEISLNGKVYKATRIVIVTDNKAPRLIVPNTVVLSSLEALDYNVNEGVKATDNSNKVSFNCTNTLSFIPDSYIIKCKAKDNNGNVDEKKRLIKVIGIEFSYDDNLTIKYPKDKNYTYKYSLDEGKTWQDAGSTVSLDFKSGNVIALVLENNSFVMASTYYKK